MTLPDWTKLLTSAHSNFSGWCFAAELRRLGADEVRVLPAIRASSSEPHRYAARFGEEWCNCSGWCFGSDGAAPREVPISLRGQAWERWGQVGIGMERWPSVEAIMRNLAECYRTGPDPLLEPYRSMVA